VPTARGPLDPVVAVVRGGVVEATHLAHVVVAPLAGPSAALAGDPHAQVLPRSSLKPLQAVATTALLAEAGHRLDVRQLAIAAASHTGADEHQVEAAGVLAEAGLDESALRCPPAWPADDRARSDLDAPTSLSHNCSGKHAAMLWAHTASGGDPAAYLDEGSHLQRRIRAVLADQLGGVSGPVVDGCGAPAWRCDLTALARAFADLAAPAPREPALAEVAAAMRAHPALVGGHGVDDTLLMAADPRVVAKRGAEGLMAVGFDDPARGPLGICVKVLDGGDRAAGPVAAAVLEALGAVVDQAVRRPALLGGGRPQGALEVDARLVEPLRGG
jgi:L-asparaginase II